MDGAEVAVNCLCSARSCATCWCPDNELADVHRGACKNRKMAEVMEQDAAREELLDKEDELLGLSRISSKWKSASDTSCSHTTLGT